MNIVGKTDTGIDVIGGVFKMVDTYGIPLEIILIKFKEDGLLVDWCDFIDNALNSNWKISSALTKIEMAVSDIYGRDYSKEVILRLQYYIAKKSK